jgi:hypothetical protein
LVLEDQDVFMTWVGAFNSCNSSLIIRIAVSVAVPRSGALLTPGFRISDPGYQTHIFESVVTIFGVKITIILGELALMVRTCICEKFLYFDAKTKHFQQNIFIFEIGRERTTMCVHSSSWGQQQRTLSLPGRYILVPMILRPKE